MKILKSKNIEKEEINIPKWHIDLVRERQSDYQKNPEQVIDFDIAMDAIEKGL